MAVVLSPDEFFTQADELPFIDLTSLVGDSGVLVVAPHPDDETLGCGGLLALCKQAGRAAHVIIVSDGTGSHPHSKRYPHDTLRDLRERETLSACQQLGLSPTDISFLRLPDRSVPAKGDDASRAIAAIEKCARAIAASTVLVTWRHDPHCDHEASFALARHAATNANVRLLEYPVWGHTLLPGTVLQGSPRGHRLDIAGVLERKRAAIAAYRSQVTLMIDDDPEGFRLPPDMIARFERPFEIYLEA